MTLDLIEVVCVYCDTLGGRQKKTLKCENDMFAPQGLWALEWTDIKR